MNQEAKLEGKLVITGLLECRDKDGALLKVIDIKMAAPMDFFAHGVSYPDTTAMLSDAEKAEIRAAAEGAMTADERAAVQSVRYGDFH